MYIYVYIYMNTYYMHICIHISIYICTILKNPQATPNILFLPLSGFILPVPLHSIFSWLVHIPTHSCFSSNTPTNDPICSSPSPPWTRDSYLRRPFKWCRVRGAGASSREGREREDAQSGDCVVGGAAGNRTAAVRVLSHIAEIVESCHLRGCHGSWEYVLSGVARNRAAAVRVMSHVARDWWVMSPVWMRHGSWERVLGIVAENSTAAVRKMMRIYRSRLKIFKRDLYARALCISSKMTINIGFFWTCSRQCCWRLNGGGVRHESCRSEMRGCSALLIDRRALFIDYRALLIYYRAFWEVWVILR